jgi:hypothetical protein
MHDGRRPGRDMATPFGRLLQRLPSEPVLRLGLLGEGGNRGQVRRWHRLDRLSQEGFRLGAAYHQRPPEQMETRCPPFVFEPIELIVLAPLFDLAASSNTESMTSQRGYGDPLCTDP